MPDYDPTDLDERDRQRKDSKARERMAEERDERDLRWLMSSRQGRRIAWRLLERAGVTNSSFSTNAMQMAFNEGFRNYGNWMLARIIAVCPEKYPELLKEQADDERNTSGDGPKSN